MYCRQQRTAFERQITEGALTASREKERLREQVSVMSATSVTSVLHSRAPRRPCQMESKEQELQRNLKQFDTFMTSQSERVRWRSRQPCSFSPGVGSND